MSAIDTLKSRNNKRIIENHYISRVLKEEASNIAESQDRIISRFSVMDTIPEIKRSRSFVVVGNELQATHALQQRFIDMRRRGGLAQKSVPIHNKIIYSHFNSLIRKLAYGFTQDIRTQIANEFNIPV